MSVMSMVQSAMKAKSPWVGIPVEGRAPFIVRRDLLVESLKGLQITEAAIQMPITGNCQPYLQVFAESGKVKAVRKFWNHPNVWDGTGQGIVNCPAKANQLWAVKERERLAKPKLKGAAKKLFDLQSKLQKKMPTPLPLKTGWAWQSSDHQDVWLEWKDSKRIRRAFKSKGQWEAAMCSDQIPWIRKPHGPKEEWKFGPQRYERVKAFLHSDECLHLKAMIEAVSNQLTN